MRNITRLLAGAVVAVGLAPQLAGAEQITVALSASATGPNASIGIPLSKGLAAAVAQMPEIAGYKVRIIDLDDASDPSTASRNAKKMIEEYKADVILGSAGVPLAAAISAVAFENKTFMVGLTPLNVPPERRGWIALVPQPPVLMVSADVEHMKKAGIKTVAYIGFSDGWGDLVYDALLKSAEPAGIKVITNERYARPDTSVTAQILKIIAAKPDAVLTGGSGTPGALPHVALAERGFKGPVYGTHALINADFIRVGGPAVNGVIAPTGPIIVAEQLPESNPIRKAGLQFRESYLKANKQPTTDGFSAYAFDGYMLFAAAAAQAAKKAKPGTAEFRKAVRDAIFTTKEVVGVHGVYNFKEGELYGVDERARVLVRLEKGEWKLMK
ncbi:MAG: ABC transporter substrate-binding protein [Alphaproteobacteria bacterium]